MRAFENERPCALRFARRRLAWAQEPARPDEAKKTPPSPRRRTPAARRPTMRRSPRPFARRSSSPPRSARRPSRTFRRRSRSSAASCMEQQRADDFQDLVPLVPGLSLTTGRPGVTRITLRGINTGGVASTDRRLLRRRAVRIEHRPGQRRDRVRRLRHVRRREGRGAAGPQGTLYGASSRRRRHEVRSEPAQHREVRGAVPWEAPRPWTTATRATP